MEDSIGRASALMSRIKWMATAVASVAVVFIVFLIPRIHATLGSADAARPVSNQTTLVERKSFSQVLRLSGTTQAARSFIVSAPQLEGAQLNNLNITSIISPGAPVKTGDVLVQFDPQAQVKGLPGKAEGLHRFGEPGGTEEVRHGNCQGQGRHGAGDRGKCVEEGRAGGPEERNRFADRRGKKSGGAGRVDVPTGGDGCAFLLL
jgi:hypothetical protein